MRRGVGLSLVLLLFILTCAPLSLATSAPETILYPTVDTYVRDGGSNRNRTFNDDTKLEIKLDRPDIQPALNRKAFLRFDLSAVEGPVQKAILWLHVQRRSSRVEPEVLLSGITDEWSAETLTWTNAPHTGGEPIGSYVVPPAGNWLAMDVTDYVNKQLSAGQVSFRLESLTDHDQGYIDLTSSRGEAGLRPHLQLLH